MSKTVFLVEQANGEPLEVSSLKEVVGILGYSVSKKDIESGEVEGVMIVDVNSDSEVEVDLPVAKVVAKAVNKAPKASKSAPKVDTKKATKKAVPDPTGDDVEYPEIGAFDDIKGFKKYVKKLTDDQLAEWCELEGATWNAIEHQSINRMRMAMAIKAKHFPETAPKSSGKSKSKYSDYTTEELLEIAVSNDVDVKDAKGDARILRMYTIMALREAGLLG